MTNAFFVALTMAAAVGSGLVGGFFFAFSVVVMKALGRLAPEHAIAAMNSINVVVLNPWFFAAFFGTAAASIVLTAYAALNWPAGAAYLVTGSVFYLVGVIAVTIVFNVPLNNALAAVDAAGTEGAALWTRYLSVWTAWNHVRTAAPLLAAASFIIALR
jgi:uncharacterized membrane protein